MPGIKKWTQAEADAQKEEISALKQTVHNQKGNQKKYLIISIVTSGFLGFVLCSLKDLL